MMGQLLSTLAKLLIAAVALCGTAAKAHELSMAEMQLREVAPGQFLMQWTATEKRAAAEVLHPVWPEGCAAEADMVRCGQEGLKGTLSIDGVGKDYSAAMVKVYWLDGQSHVYTLTAGQPTVQLYGAADDQRGMGEVARAYTLLGVQHILGGFDHLLFVIGLLFLVGFNRQLFWTITAFTAAHSLTLACSALGWLTLRPAPVEAAIAMSIVLVAGEALHTRETLGRRWPALVAFLFGLVHGLGFAGALREIGLPQQHLLMALFTFNVGVELGQLMAVAAAWVLHRVWLRWPMWAHARMAALYGIGSIAAYWSWLRLGNIFLR